MTHLTDDKVIEITCEIADEILQEMMPSETDRLIYEDTNSTYYTDNAQNLFNEWYDVIEGIIKS